MTNHAAQHLVMRFFCASIVASFAWLAATSTVRSDEASQVVGTLFGEKIKKVEATAGRADDVALATEMLEAARGETVTPVMRAALCDKASELALRDVSGFAAAIEAVKAWPVEGTAAEQATIVEKQADILTRIFQTGKPADRAPAGAMLIDLLVLSGDDKMDAGKYAEAVAVFRKASTLAPRAKPDAAGLVKSKLDLAVYRERTARSIEQLRAKLLENRSDPASAEALVKLLLIDQQDVKTARTYLDAVKDESLRKVVALLAMPTADLNTVDAMMLAEWFMAAARTAQGHALASALTQAKANYEQVLARGEADNLTRTKASLELKDIAQKIARLEAPPIRPGKEARLPVNLLALVDANKDVMRGKWEQAKSGSLRTSESAARVLVPVTIDGDYRLSATFIRHSGDNGTVCVSIPVGEKTIMASLEGANQHSGFDWLEGKGRDIHTHAHAGKLITNGQKHLMEVDVKIQDQSVSLMLSIDGKTVTKWSGPLKSLSSPDWARPPKSASPVLMAWDCDLEFISVSLKMVSGEAKLLRDQKSK